MKLHCKILLIALLFATTVCNAQEQSPELPKVPNYLYMVGDSIKKYSSFTKAKKNLKLWQVEFDYHRVKTYRFNKNGEKINLKGKPIEKIKQVNDSVKEVYKLSSYLHDEGKRKTGNQNYFLAHTITYNKHNQITAYTEYKQNLSKIKITYNYNNNLLTKITRKEFKPPSAISEKQKLSILSITTLQYTNGRITQINKEYNDYAYYNQTTTYNVFYDDTFRVNTVNYTSKFTSLETNKVTRENKNITFNYQKNGLTYALISYNDENGYVTENITFIKNKKNQLKKIIAKRYTKTKRGAKADKADATEVTTYFIRNKDENIRAIKSLKNNEIINLTTIKYEYYKK